MHPILFELPSWLGGLEIPTYGALMVLALLVGGCVFAWLAGRHGCSRERAFEAAIEVMLVSVVSSKVVGLLFQPPGEEPLHELLLRTGGVWYVGFLTGIAWASWRLKQIGLGRLQALDIAAAAVASGHWVGRVGCFMAGCCWGAPCELPWSVTFTEAKAHELTGVPLNVPMHPTQLYEAAAELLTALLLVTLLRRRWYRFHLQVGLTYLVVYACVRFTIELFRVDPRGQAGAFSTSQWIALAVLAVAVPLYAIGWTRGTLRPGKAVPGGEVEALSPRARGSA